MYSDREFEEEVKMMMKAIERQERDAAVYEEAMRRIDAKKREQAKIRALLESQEQKKQLEAIAAKNAEREAAKFTEDIQSVIVLLEEKQAFDVELNAQKEANMHYKCTGRWSPHVAGFGDGVPIFPKQTELHEKCKVLLPKLKQHKEHHDTFTKVHTFCSIYGF
jgi:hypothetical protein